MTVLVAGGAGFIGSNLCARLIREGHEVICLDNLVTGRYRNIEQLTDYPGFRFIEHDVIQALPPLPDVTEIFHLASPASPAGYHQRPVETLRANSEGTYLLLELASSVGARFLFTSTSEAYGDPLVHPQDEEYRGNVSSTGPRSMYDEAKRFGEAMTVAFERSRDVDARVVRVFNTYGPNSDPGDGRLVPNFITQALTGVPMTIYGDGKQTRSLCFVSDLVDGLLRVMAAPQARGEVINLGNTQERTVLEFAELIKESTGSLSPLEFVEPAVGDDPQRRRPDIDKARRLLDWTPTVDLRDGIDQTVEYFRTELATTS